jgi:tRNA(Ile)-lysidine synthase
VYGRLFFEEGPVNGGEGFEHLLPGPGRFYLKEIGRTIVLELAQLEDAVPSLPERNTGMLDAEKAGFPLVLRTWRPGDRFIPLGMKGRRKLKDLFIDLKIPSEERRRMPIVVSGGQPVWIGGLRIDERFKVTPETGTVLKIRME